jgi:hypothetical protein
MVGNRGKGCRRGAKSYDSEKNLVLYKSFNTLWIVNLSKDKLITHVG